MTAPAPTASTRCKTCGGEMIQKNRARLLLVGGALVCAALGGSALATNFSPWLWPAALLVIGAGGYLIVWGTLGRGRWCRRCKKFSL